MAFGGITDVNILHDVSIRRKLTLIILMVTGVVLLLASAVFVACDRIDFKNRITCCIENMSELIANSSVAGIRSNDASSTESILASLRMLPFINSAVVYTADGDVFASYGSQGSTEHVESRLPGDTGLVLHDIMLKYTRAVEYDGERIGTVRIDASLFELDDRLKRHAGIVAMFVPVAIAVAFGMATRLQRIISGPLLYLTHLARTVTAKEDYTIRAEKYGDDEIGILIDSFNDMLSNIQDRDAALQKAHDNLTEWTQQLQVELVDRKKTEDRITKSLREKEVLIKEIHHRVKNNLQVISSLLSLQSRIIKDPKAMEMFTESQHRIRSMGLIHEKLYQSQDLALVDFSEYVRNLATSLFHSYAVNSGRIGLAINVKDIYLGVDTAVPCGLILNELISNSFKHAFPAGEAGEVAIGLHHKENGTLQMTVSDNGRGLPPNLDFHGTESLGMQLVTTLTSQLRGTIVLDRSCGTTFRITFEE